MNYVEWLRVRNCLRVTAIILTLLVLIVLVLRISFNRYMSYDAWIEHMQLQPGSHVTHTVLPDGTKRTTVDDPKDQTRIVLDDVAGGGRHIQVTEPTTSAHEHQQHVNMGSITVHASQDGKFTTTTIDSNSSVPLLFYMGFADVVALIVATVLGAPFARENDGHLEFALTKPATRLRIAIGTMGADIVGILAASVLTFVALYLCQIVFQSTRIDATGVNLRALLMGIALPIAWYALLCAATASLRRGYGAVLGFAWPVAILIVVFAEAPIGSSLLAQTFHNTFWVLSRIDPLSYASFDIGSSPHAAQAQATFAARYLVEIALFALYSVAAVMQWRRVEA